MIDVSSKLKKLRKEHGYTIQFVCDSVDIPLRTYQNYEYGKREISAEAILKLCNFYGVTTDYLLGRPDAKPPDDPVDLLPLEVQNKAIIQAYISLKPEERTELVDIIKKLAAGAELKMIVNDGIQENVYPTAKPAPMVARAAPKPLEQFTAEQDAQLLSAEVDPDDL